MAKAKPHFYAPHQNVTPVLLRDYCHEFIFEVFDKITAPPYMSPYAVHEQGKVLLLKFMELLALYVMNYHLRKKSIDLDITFHDAIITKVWVDGEFLTYDYRYDDVPGMDSASFGGAPYQLQLSILLGIIEAERIHEENKKCVDDLNNKLNKL